MNISEHFHGDNVISISAEFLPSDYIFIPSIERKVFLIVFALLLVISFTGNVAAIVVTIQRKHRFIQKTCIVSLSLSDLIMTAAYCTNNMESFSHPMKNWTLGSFLCSFIPMMQIFGLVVNLASIVLVAMDRYINVVKTMAHRWNPSPFRCLIGFGVLWIACLGISYPIYPLFSIKIGRVYYDVPASSKYIKYPFCVTQYKDKLQKYYISITVLVFSTLWGCLLYLNCSVARLVWRHRKPICLPIQVEASFHSAETSSTQLTGTLPTPASNCNPGKKVRIEKCVPSPHFARRIRTFKIIVIMMLVFTACRLPFWVYNIIKLTYVYENWLMMYIFNALAVLNGAINPFLYTFLNQTIQMLCKVSNFVQDCVRKLCCWYCNATEFDEFGKDNPFCTEIKGNCADKY